MKILAYIKKDLRLFKSDLISSFIMLFIFPIALSSFYGFFQDKAFQGSATVEKFTVAIIDKDNSESSKLVKDVFKSEGLGDIIGVKDKDGDIEVVIPEGFQKSIEEGSNTTLSINQVKKDSALQAHIVEGILDNLAQNISLVNGVNKNIYSSSLSDSEKQKLAESYGQQLSDMFKTSAIKEDTLSLNNRLNSIEYYSVTMLTFIAVLLIASYSVEFIKERKEGTYRRIFSISIDGRSMYLGKIGSLFIVSTLSILCYVLFYRLTGKAFHGNLLLLMLAVIITGLLIAALTGLAISVFKEEKVARIVLPALMMFGLMAGGVFFPIDIIDNKILNIVSKLTPNIWIADMYKKLGIYNSFSAMFSSISVLLAVIVVSFIIGSFKMSRTLD